MENKEVLIRNIMLELNQIPAVYLQNLWNIIHTFRENIPAKETMQNIDNQEIIENIDEDWQQFDNELKESREGFMKERREFFETLFTKDEV